MKLYVYSIFDKAVNAYMRPFFMQSDGQALRMFIDEVSKDDSELGKHPEDYSLFLIGWFEDRAGEICKEEVPKCLGRAHELKIQQES